MRSAEQRLTRAVPGGAGGRRLLRRWLCRPLMSLGEIAARQDAVAELAGRPGLAAPLRAGLRRLGDLERALGQARRRWPRSTYSGVRGSMHSWCGLCIKYLACQELWALAAC